MSRDARLTAPPSEFRAAGLRTRRADSCLTSRACPYAAAVCLACCVALAMIAAGCQTAAPAARQTGIKTGVETDPCADRLHEISGRLLLYYSVAGKMPPVLANLKGVDSDPMPPLACPASGKPYVYNPVGLVVQGQPGRLVIYDPAPSHNGKRWGILAAITAGDQPLSSRVVLVPEGPIFAVGK